MVTLLAFLFTLGILITLHEYGHYRVAVACGVKVLRFSIGFGRPIFSWRSARPRPGQDTEFVIGLIPLGGYVQMLDESDGEVAAADLPRAFNRQPLRSRVAIVAAGPLANLVLAIVLLSSLAWWGQWETKAILAMPAADSLAQRAGLQSGDQVMRVARDGGDPREILSYEDLRWWLLHQGQEGGQVSLEVSARGTQETREVALDFAQMTQPVDEPAWWRELGLQGPWTAPILGELVAGGVAQQAGLRRGDQILKIQGRTVQDAQHLRTLIRQSVQGEGVAEGPLVWEVSRRGQFGVLLIEVQPRRVEVEGQVIGRVDAMIGEAPAKVWVQQGFVDGWAKGLQRTWELSWLTLRTLGKILIGEASVRHLSGPLTMAEYAGKSAQLGLAAFLNYLALVSISLGVLNLLPIPVLDGGHLMYYLWEGLTRRRPSLAWTGWLQRLGTAFVLLLMLIALRNDLLRWLEGG